MKPTTVSLAKARCAGNVPVRVNAAVPCRTRRRETWSSGIADPFLNVEAPARFHRRERVRFDCQCRHDRIANRMPIPESYRHTSITHSTYSEFWLLI